MMRIPSELLAATLSAILAGLAVLVAVGCAAHSLGVAPADVATPARVLAALAAVGAGCLAALTWRAVTDDL